ncbi:MAG: hypothetical protein HF962_04840 [Sulfurovum sp.]|nr:hypothetical protein [Sulfurovum sp.]
MLIFGHPWIKSKKFKKIFSIDETTDVTSDEIILLEPLSDSISIAQHCQAKQIEFAVTITGITDALFANALQSKYLVCQMEDVVSIQSIAQEYLFDSKVLTLISNEKEIKKMAELSIDAVMFPEAIIQN